METIPEYYFYCKYCKKLPRKLILGIAGMHENGPEGALIRSRKFEKNSYVLTFEYRTRLPVWLFSLIRYSETIPEIPIEEFLLYLNTKKK